MKILNPKNINSSEIKNLIFDWGGVIINIDYNATSKAFNKLGIKNFDEHYSQADQRDLFNRLEIGTISPIAFCEEVRQHFNVKLSDKEIYTAWSAMLLDIPKTRIELLQKLGKKYRIFLLSNTNLIHEQMLIEGLNKQIGFEFFSLFEKVYLSHRLGMRKPNSDIFMHVLDENELNIDESLFIDDSEQHIDGAANIGLKALFLQKGMEITDIFKEWAE